MAALRVLEAWAAADPVARKLYSRGRGHRMMWYAQEWRGRRVVNYTWLNDDGRLNPQLVRIVLQGMEQALAT